MLVSVTLQMQEVVDSEACEDSSDGALDTDGYGCDGYIGRASDCGSRDDDDFDAKILCCACGGGPIQNVEATYSDFGKAAMTSDRDRLETMVPHATHNTSPSAELITSTIPMWAVDALSTLAPWSALTSPSAELITSTIPMWAVDALSTLAPWSALTSPTAASMSNAATMGVAQWRDTTTPSATSKSSKLTKTSATLNTSTVPETDTTAVTTVATGMLRTTLTYGVSDRTTNMPLEPDVEYSGTQARSNGSSFLASTTVSIVAATTLDETTTALSRTTTTNNATLIRHLSDLCTDCRRPSRKGILAFLIYGVSGLALVMSVWQCTSKITKTIKTRDSEYAALFSRETSSSRLIKVAEGDSFLI